MKRTKLEEMTQMYARALKGGEEGDLIAFVHPSAQRSFLKNSAMLKDLQFSDVEVRKIFPDEKMSSAIVLMNLEYYSIEDSRLMAAVRQYNWVYEPSAKVWLLKDSSPFGSKE